MPTVSEDDFFLLQALDRWSETAFAELDDIAAWRATSRRKPAAVEADLFAFFRDTTAIVTACAAMFPNISAAAVEEYHGVVREWYFDAARLPGDDEIENVFAKAMVVVNAMRNAVLASANRLIPSEMQILILQHLDGRAATSEGLLAALNCGSKETLYGKNGRGGLRELTALELVKNDRRLGGYYRPDRPPDQKAY